MEIWKDIEGFEGIYQASNLGRIRSIDREYLMMCRWGKLIKKKISGRIKKTSMTGPERDYVGVSLYKNNIGYPCSVHRIIAKTFVFKEDGKDYVNHKNGIKTDNRAENLEWVTSKENTNHAISMGLLRVVGEENPSSILKEKDIRDIRTMRRSGKKYREISEIYGVSKATIQDVISGRTWKNTI